MTLDPDYNFGLGPMPWWWAPLVLVLLVAVIALLEAVWQRSGARRRADPRPEAPRWGP